MLKYLSKKTLQLTGWNLNIVLPKEKKFVLIGAPHTSNWDFPLALLAFWTLDIKLYWVAKKQMFWGPLHYLFTYLGGIPVDRNSSQGFIQQIANKIEQTDEIAVAIAPEGTRSKTDYWKSGFYHLAVTAKVPICLAYIDFSNHTLGFEQVLYPGGNIDEDMKIIAEFYKKIKGKRPHLQGPVRLKKN